MKHSRDTNETIINSLLKIQALQITAKLTLSPINKPVWKV